MLLEGAAKQEKDEESEIERERETASALKIISVKHGPQFAYQTRALVGGIVSGRTRAEGGAAGAESCELRGRRRLRRRLVYHSECRQFPCLKFCS